LKEDKELENRFKRDNLKMVLLKVLKICCKDKGFSNRNGI
jgi:hypothetical protein